MLYPISLPQLLLSAPLAGSANNSTRELLWLLGVVVAALLILAMADRASSTLRALLKSRREAHRTPGSSPLHPINVASYDEVFRRRTGKCVCDSAPKVVFEGATTSNQRRLWLVIQICPACDRRMQTYYDVTRAKDTPLGSAPVTPAPRL